MGFSLRVGAFRWLVVGCCALGCSVRVALGLGGVLTGWLRVGE